MFFGSYNDAVYFNFVLIQSQARENTSCPAIEYFSRHIRHLAVENSHYV